MKKSKLFLFALSILFFLISIRILSVNSTVVETVTVSIRGINGLAINLDQGEMVQGSFSISGVLGVGFEIKSPVGERVVGYTWVNEGTTFEIIAESKGAYTLSFRNDSNHYDALVTVSYDVHPGIDEVTYNVLLVGMAFFLILLVSIAFVYWRFRKK